MINTSASSISLGNSIELPCGANLKNRLAKSAMSDSLANGEGDPTAAQIRLYERWAEGGIALSIIGEVQGDSRFPEKPGNLVLGSKTNQETLHSLTSRSTIEGAHLWAQLGHGGALSHPPISKPKGPSALNIGEFQCAGMSMSEIQELPNQFARTATRAKAAGFSGVQVHAAHGFLLSQFLSPLFNRRSDGYGGSIEARCRIVTEVIERVRKAVGPSFPIGIKINSTDQLEGGLTQDDALEAVRLIDRTSIDLIEISGGTYFPGAKASSDSSGGGPYFLDFAQRAREITTIPLMLTGGFKKRQQAADVLSSGTVDIVGLARAMVLNSSLPETWSTEEGGDPEFPRFDSPLPRGGITAWYTMRLTVLAEDQEDAFTLDLPSALRIYEERDDLRCNAWRKKFIPVNNQAS